MPDSKKRVLILFAHPSHDRSEVNVPVYKASCGLDGVTVVDLYGEYPDYRINVDREQERLVEHDVVVFMFPLYWYSTPSLLKEWQDLVLEYGFAYRSEGTALRGKTFLCALSAGGAARAYRADVYNYFTIRELLQPLEQTVNLTGMRYLPPIEPFKGLLLGLFFITVGAGINFTVLTDNLGTVLAVTFSLMLIKALILLILALLFKLRGTDRWLFSLGLAQAGEFGFVLLSYTVNYVKKHYPRLRVMARAFDRGHGWLPAPPPKGYTDNIEQQ